MSSTDADDEDWREDPEPDPPSLGPETPSVDVPEVDVYTPDTLTPGEDVDRETYRLFWRLVIVFDVALLALSLGPMFVYFRGNWRRGLTLFVFGALVFAYGVARYREFRRSDEDGADDDASDAGETTADAADRCS